MVETIAFDMDGGAGSRNTSGERGWPRPCAGQEGGHTSWDSVGTPEDVMGSQANCLLFSGHRCLLIQ